MTSSNGNIFRVTGPLCGEFTGPGEIPTQRPVTRGFDVFLYLRLNKWLSKQPRGSWFETPSWSLWRHCNVKNVVFYSFLNANVLIHETGSLCQVLRQRSHFLEVFKSIVFRILPLGVAIKPQWLIPLLFNQIPQPTSNICCSDHAVYIFYIQHCGFYIANDHKNYSIILSTHTASDLTIRP